VFTSAPLGSTSSAHFDKLTSAKAQYIAMHRIAVQVVFGVLLRFEIMLNPYWDSLPLAAE